MSRADDARMTGLDPEFADALEVTMRDLEPALRRLAPRDGGHGLIDARPLKVIMRPWAIPAKLRAQSIFWHHHDAQPCDCPDTWIHSMCYRVDCPCRRHIGEIR